MRFGHGFQKATLALTALAVGLWAPASQAELRSLGGNARFQIGNGLPIPIVLNPPPGGDVFPVAGAQVQGLPGGTLLFTQTGQLTHPGTKRTQGVFLANSNVFQVATQLHVAFPAQLGSLKPGGRTGPATVNWCPGTPASQVAKTPTMCGTNQPVGGNLTYTKTTAQFGGPLRGAIGPGGPLVVPGRATVALRAGGTPPGVVTAANAFASPSGLAVIGGAFNENLTSSAPPPGLSGVFRGSANAFGTITKVLTTALGAGVGNGATSYGAPWTTGQLIVSQTSASPPEVFTLTGSDSRTASGAGSISLVAGALSNRVLSGPNGNRGWLNLTIGAVVPSVPAVPPGAIAAASGLLTLLAGYALRRRQQG